MTQRTGRGWYPKAEHKPIKAGDNDPAIIPALAILHVAVSWATTLFSFFKFRSGGIESHFYIQKNGTVEQYRSVLREADANLGANSYLVAGERLGAVSIETAGLASGWWNAKQKAAIQDLLLWLNAEHKIPLKPVLISKPSLAQGGVSYHTRFKSWSPVAKSCPGPNRIEQYRDWLKPWMAGITNCTGCPVHCPPKES